LQLSRAWLRRAWPAYAAATLAFASAAVSLFWTLGGTFLLDTVGESLEDLARERSVRAFALGTTVIVLKVASGLLALALVRPWGTRLGRRLLLTANWIGSAILLLWGGTSIIAGALVLSNVITPSEPVDERALRFHVFLWDLWFVVWGAALALATARRRRQ